MNNTERISLVVGQQLANVNAVPDSPALRRVANVEDVARLALLGPLPVVNGKNSPVPSANIKHRIRFMLKLTKQASVKRFRPGVIL